MSKANVLIAPTKLCRQNSATDKLSPIAVNTAHHRRTLLFVNEKLYEVVKTAQPITWRAGCDLTSNSHISGVSAFDVRFLLLSDALDATGRFIELDSRLAVYGLTAMANLPLLSQENLEVLFETKFVEDTGIFIRYDERRTNIWLKAKLAKLTPCFVNYEERAAAYAMALLADYLPVSLAESFAKAEGINVAPLAHRADHQEFDGGDNESDSTGQKSGGEKRKSDLKEKSAPKSKLTASDAKGMKSISSFFTKK